MVEAACVGARGGRVHGYLVVEGVGTPCVGGLVVGRIGRRTRVVRLIRQFRLLGCGRNAVAERHRRGRLPIAIRPVELLSMVGDELGFGWLLLSNDVGHRKERICRRVGRLVRGSERRLLRVAEAHEQVLHAVFLGGRVQIERARPTEHEPRAIRSVVLRRPIVHARLPRAREAVVGGVVLVVFLELGDAVRVFARA